MASLEYLAGQFLRWEKKCFCVIRERCPRFGNGLPDVLGITKARYLYEIEIKRTLSDFKANADKHHIMVREGRVKINAHYWRKDPLKKAPKLFWYLVPSILVDKVQPLLPEWAGLMSAGEDYGRVRVIVPAKSNKESPRLTIEECVRLTHMMSNNLASYERVIEDLLGRRNTDFFFDYSI
jgi:hypothetical protein